jgi:hypothetical protein
VPHDTTRLKFTKPEAKPASASTVILFRRSARKWHERLSG